MNVKKIVNSVMGFGLLICLFVSQNAIAQNAEEISDEELMKYAVVEDSVLGKLKDLNDQLNDMIKAEELMQGGRRYLEISKVKNDVEKLRELEVTEEEMEVFTRLNQKEESIKTEIVEFKTALVRNEDLMGVPLYNKVTRGVRANPELKAKLDQLMAELKAKREADAANTEE
jgi:hypothetical protein